jgi:hypothetical protein
LKVTKPKKKNGKSVPRGWTKADANMVGANMAEHRIAAAKTATRRGAKEEERRKKKEVGACRLRTGLLPRGGSGS